MIRAVSSFGNGDLARKEAEYEALKAEIAALRQVAAELPRDAALASDRKSI